MVGIVEPEHLEIGSVEAALRDYNLTAGLIDATDARMLSTLDVIILGTNFSTSVSVLRAVSRAVYSGVGLLREWWLGLSSEFEDEAWDDPESAELILSASPVASVHIPGCAAPLRATVMQAHPLLGELQVGQQLDVSGCGPVYVPLPSARVLIQKDILYGPEVHHIPGVGPIHPPAYLIGELGRGRVVVAQLYRHGTRVKGFGVGDDYMMRVIAWLADPRREM